MGGVVGDYIVLCRSKIPADYSAANFPSDTSYPVILVGRKSSPETSSGTLAVLYKDLRDKKIKTKGFIFKVGNFFFHFMLTCINEASIDENCDDELDFAAH